MESTRRIEATLWNPAHQLSVNQEKGDNACTEPLASVAVHATHLHRCCKMSRTPAVHSACSKGAFSSSSLCSSFSPLPLLFFLLLFILFFLLFLWSTLCLLFYPIFLFSPFRSAPFSSDLSYLTNESVRYLHEYSCDGFIHAYIVQCSHQRKPSVPSALSHISVMETFGTLSCRGWSRKHTISLHHHPHVTAPQSCLRLWRSIFDKLLCTLRCLVSQHVANR